MSFTGKRILVTGGNGFLGTRLVPALESAGAEVTVLTNAAGGNPGMIEADITRHLKIDCPADLIIHLAAMVSVPFCQQNPAKAFEVNAQGTANVLEYARKIDAEYFVYSSTAKVYGRAPQCPTPESAPAKPQTIYGYSKRAGELACECYSENYGLDTAILRQSNIIGPSQTGDYVVPSIISQARKGNDLHLGNTKPKRDFVFVDDVVSAYRTILEKRAAGIMNIGSGESHSADEIIKALEKITGKNLRTIADPEKLREQEPDKELLDITRMKRLGWAPTTRFEDAIKAIWEASA